MNRPIVAPALRAFCVFCERVALAAVLSLLSLSALSQNAQIQNSKFEIQNYGYEGLKCRGEMPADIRKNIDQLYNEDKQRVRDYTGGKLANKDQVRESAYYISLLMSSGRVLYGDTITRTIERIADTLLKDYPELRRELRFYTVKSTDVNAFATGQGMVFVNLGLVAKVKDEAQLAFVLAHEIVHYQRKHALENITRNRSRCDTNSREGMNDFLRYHHRSRQMESEADSLGIELFYKNSGYDKKVADGFFDVLQYGYLPFAEMPFDTMQFNSPYFKLSAGSFQETVKPVSARDDYNDMLSTHPNLRKRREATLRLLNQASPLAGGATYLVTTPSEFDYLRTLARFECIRIDLADAEFASAYYNSCVLLNQMPNNEFLLMSRARALYGAAKFRNYSAAANVTDSKDKEGEVQQAYHFMRRCRPVELNIVALREVWKTHQMMPDNEQLTEMAADLAYDLSSRNHLKADVFVADGTQATVPAANNTQEASQSQNQSSTRRNRRQEQQKQYRYAFSDLMMEDATFQPFLQKWGDGPQAPLLADNKGIILFDPTYFVYNSRSNEMKTDKAIERQNKMADIIGSVAKKCGLDVVDFSDQAMRGNGTQAAVPAANSQTNFYNDFMTICEWYSEYGRTDGNVPMHFAAEPAMAKLMARYNVDKILLSQVVNAENVKKPECVWFLLGGAISVVMFPEALYYSIFQREETQVRNRIVSIADGTTVAGERSFANTDDSRAFVRSQTYAQIMRNKTNNPGYLGRHLAITGTCGLSFPVLGRPFDRPDVDALALRWGGGIEYAVRSQSSLALYADYASTTFDIRNEPFNTATAGITTVALTYRMYTGDHVAPLGNYWGVGAAYSNLSLEPTQKGVQFAFVDDKYNRFAIHLECGRNFIIGDIIMINVGARYNITLANPLRVFDTSYTLDNRQKDAVRSVNANLFMYNILLLNLSVGFMPF